MVEIKTGAWLIGNRDTEVRVIQAIENAKKKGWELFSAKQLEENAIEWGKTLTDEVKKYPKEWLLTAKQSIKSIPLMHIVDPEFIVPIIKRGHILSLASRGGKGRTVGYEMALGLGDYVYLSFPTWEGAPGWPIYFSPMSILEREGTTVTMGDISEFILRFPFDERIKLYQRMAFKGESFKKLLPLFLVAHYGDLKRPHKRRASGYPSWVTEDSSLNFLLDNFCPEIKVKGRLYLSDSCRIYVPAVYRKGREVFTEDEASMIEEIKGIKIPVGCIEKWTEKEISAYEEAFAFPSHPSTKIPEEFKEGWGLSFLENVFRGRINGVEVGFLDPGGRLKSYIDKGKEWWE